MSASSKAAIALLVHCDSCLRQLITVHDCSNRHSKLDSGRQTIPADNRKNCNVTCPRL